MKEPENYYNRIFNYRGLQESIARIMNEAKDGIVAEMKRQHKFVTGRTAEAIEVQTEATNDGVITGRILAPISLLTLETGRKEGKVPYNFVQILLRWTIDKRLTFKSETARRSFAYFTARKIATEGSKIHRSGVREDVYTSVLLDTTERIKKRCEELGEIYDVNRLEQTLPTTKISFVL